MSSGTDALLLALMALDIRAGDEVVTSTYSFFATAGAVARLGAKPVLVDIDDATFNLDPERLAAAITPRTKAIIPVHLFGLSADMDPILDIAARAGVPVVEDAAQAIGASYKSRLLGGLGAVGCFSFFPSKNLGAFGDAGLLTTNDDGAGEAGAAPPHPRHGAAATTITSSAATSAWTRCRRRSCASRRRIWPRGPTRGARTRPATATLFRDAGLLDRVTLPVEPPDRWHIFNQFVIRTGDRDGLKAHLDERGIGTEIYYPVPFHLQPCFAYLGYRRGDFPQAERAAAESLALPIYGELTAAQQEAVVDAIGDYVLRRVGV